MSTESLEQHRRQPFSNALWLTDQQVRPSAVITLGYPDGILLDAFSGMVERLNDLTWANIEHTRIPADHESTSLVVIETRTGERSTASGPQPPSYRSLSTLIQECFRLLERNGTLMVVGENPFWFRRVMSSVRRTITLKDERTVGDLSARLWARSMRSRGFSRVNTFLLTPAYSHPSHMIPANGPAAAVHEEILDPSRHGRIRRTMARWGGHGVLHPGHLIVGEKG